MTDMDFDELDRAVNSLMTKHQAGRSGSEPTDKPDDSQTEVQLDPSVRESNSSPLAVSESQVTNESDQMTDNLSFTDRASDTDSAEATVSGDDNLTETLDETDAVEPQPQAVPRPRVSLPSRRSGRFMDVVHPSSDMRTDSTSASTPARPVAVQAPTPAVSRNGITLGPVSREFSQPVTEVQQPEGTDLVEATNIDAHSDILDTPLLEAHSVSPDVEESTSADIIDDMLIETPASQNGAPLSTPFLTDAKVDKRPLGGSVAVAEPEEEPANSQQADSGYSPTSTYHSDDAQMAPDRIVPAELRNDLMSLESDNTQSGHHDEHETASQPQAAQPTALAAPAVATPQPQPAGPTAITQQYQQEPSSSPTESGSIYDTADYHQPLAHPQKKSSGWMWVVWVLVLLVLGAGSGAAAYFLLIQ